MFKTTKKQIIKKNEGEIISFSSGKVGDIALYFMIKENSATPINMSSKNAEDISWAKFGSPENIDWMISVLKQVRSLIK